MPHTSVRVYRSSKEAIPLLEDWLDQLEETEPRAYAKCLAFILRLENFGNELRRPTADLLRDGIYELRMKVGSVNYRILYFFCGSNVVCLSHGIMKKGKVPDGEIDLAVKRKSLVEQDLDKYTAEWEG